MKISKELVQQYIDTLDFNQGDLTLEGKIDLEIHTFFEWLQKVQKADVQPIWCNYCKKWMSDTSHDMNLNNLSRLNISNVRFDERPIFERVIIECGMYEGKTLSGSQLYCLNARTDKNKIIYKLVQKLMME